MVEGIHIMNENNWFPVLTFIVGLPNETDEDLEESLDLLYRLRNFKALFIPSLFTPLDETRMADGRPVKSRELTKLQWEFITQCWRHNIDFWAPDDKFWIHSLIFSVFWTISRWKHGRHSTKPVMKLAGFPDSFLGGAFVSKSDGSFNPDFEIPLAGENVSKEIDRQSAEASSGASE